MAHQPFRPVIVGPDLGVYSLVRSFHEAYGVRSVVVSNTPRGPIADSALIDNVYAGAGATAERVVATLEQVADAHPGERLLLLVNAEHDVEMVLHHRERLEARYVVPMAGSDVLARAADKEVLQEVCTRLGLPVPRTIAVSMEGVRADGAPALPLTFPVVLKPAVSGAYLLHGFPGQRKVYDAADEAGAHAVLRTLADAGLEGDVLVQELVPGDDTCGRTVTCYRDRAGRVTVMASGQLLLGLHKPTLIGNSAAILTEPQPELEEQAAAVLAELGYTGYANFDLKIDPRDGRARFLDLNPRIGRPNYYVNVAGVNPVLGVVEDYFGDGAGPVRTGREVGLYSYLPWFLLRRYLEPELRRKVAAVRRRNGQSHPLAYRGDRNARRVLYRRTADLNQVRDFAKHYPRPTSTGF